MIIIVYELLTSYTFTALKSSETFVTFQLTTQGYMPETEHFMAFVVRIVNPTRNLTPHTSTVLESSSLLATGLMQVSAYSLILNTEVKCSFETPVNPPPPKQLYGGICWLAVHILTTAVKISNNSKQPFSDSGDEIRANRYDFSRYVYPCQKDSANRIKKVIRPLSELMQTWFSVAGNFEYNFVCLHKTSIFL
jgi:hypothetical protein